MFMAICNDGAAMKAGTNAGIVAAMLMQLMEEGCAMDEYGKRWCRCSVKTITVAYPFLSEDQVKRSIKVLRNMGIIRSKKFDKEKFDHTNWYAFTEYGLKIMKWGERNGQKTEAEGYQ